MPALDRLIGLSLVAIRDATAALERGGSAAAWERAMERALTTAHTAAYVVATAERLGVRPDSPLISRQRLSRAERADIAAAVRRQMEYLRGFAAALPGLSPAQVRARADLYGPSIKAFYYAQRWGDWEIPDRLLPGMQTCMGNCLCRLTDVRDNGDGTGVVTRVMEGDEQGHCDECPPLAGDHPVKRRRAA